MEIYEFTEPSWSILPILSASTITPIGKWREMVREKKRRKKISFRDSENKSSVIRPGARGPESPAPNPQTIDQEWRQISPENCVPRSAVAGFSWSDFYYSRSLIGTFCIHHTNLQRILPVCRIWDKFVIFDIDFWRDHWGADSLPASIDSTGLLSSLFKPFFLLLGTYSGPVLGYFGSLLLYIHASEFRVSGRRLSVESRHTARTPGLGVKPTLPWVFRGIGNLVITGLIIDAYIGRHGCR